MCRNREAFQGAPQGTRRDPAECKVSEAPTAAGFRGAEMYDGSREADAGGLERQSPAWGVYARSRGACSRTMLVESAEQARQRGRWLSMWATRRHDAAPRATQKVEHRGVKPQPLVHTSISAATCSLPLRRFTARALLDRGAESTEAAPITHGPASGCVVERLRGLLVRVGKVLERERQARLGWAASARRRSRGRGVRNGHHERVPRARPGRRAGVIGDTDHIARRSHGRGRGQGNDRVARKRGGAETAPPLSSSVKDGGPCSRFHASPPAVRGGGPRGPRWL
mmetsp:Transcript_7583/g.25686  ORF Transcript_7583/g.25686 Transcript_7583/m.25686 type:complete len:283 (-) Transcript_7583:67-915(-)